MKKLISSTLVFTMIFSIFSLAPESVTAASKKSKLKISKAAKPNNVFQKIGFQPKGIVTSNYKIKTITVGIYPKNGGKTITKKVKPGKKSYNLARLKKSLGFEKLETGNYTYKITARDSSMKKEKTLVKKNFSVYPNKVSLTSKLILPTDIDTGKSFTITGSLLSPRKIQAVTAEIFTEEGRLVRTTTVKPNKTQYNLATFSKKVPFAKLASGNYRIRLSVQDTGKKVPEVLGESHFKVAIASTLIAKGNRIDAKIVRKTSAAYVGQVTSNYEISQVIVGIYDKKNRVQQSRKFTNVGQSVTIDTKEFLSFEKLAQGDYTLRITARDDRYSKARIIMNQPFMIGPVSKLNRSQYVSPEKMGIGTNFYASGFISSNYLIQTVKVSVFDQNGKRLSSKTIRPNTTKADLYKLKAYSKFKNLGYGTYRYEITATDEVTKTEKLVYQGDFQVVAKSKMKATKGKSATSFKIGKKYKVNGNITSNYKITSLTTRIYNSKGKQITQGTVQTNANATSFNISKADLMGTFGNVAPGKYSYTIYATDEVSGLKKLFSGKVQVKSPQYALPVTGKGTSVADRFNCRCWAHRGKHNGIDMRTSGKKSKIKAPHDGIVRIITTCKHDYPKAGARDCPDKKTCGNAGNSLAILDPVTGIETKYMHLSSFSVKNGQKVKAGKVIGRVGNTGRSTGRHLHFELRQRGVLRDPLLFVKL